MRICRALLSVSDKTGLVQLARGLSAHGVELLSTGGTAAALREAGLPVKDVSEHTGFPEMLDGRVKTLHPLIHGGLLYRRDLPAHVDQATAHGIAPIDLVVVNLYPFEQTVVREGVSREEAIENIDIGGPSMLRSAAKNHAAVTVLCHPDDYGSVLRDMEQNDGATTLELRAALAAKVFALTSRYDGAIAAYLQAAEAPEFSVREPMVSRLRYGENPHQQAERYGRFAEHLEQRGPRVFVGAGAVAETGNPCLVGVGVHVEGRRQSPALRTENEPVIAQMVIAITDRHIEHNPPE